MERMPSPARAERNQRRKAAFIPMWPLIGAVVVMVVFFLLVT